MNRLFTHIAKKDEAKSHQDFLDTAKQIASEISQELLKDESTVYFDLETTGVIDEATNSYPEIVQIALLNHKGQPLFCSLICPRKAVPIESSKIHGIYDVDVMNCPRIEDIIEVFSKVIENKKIVVYNANFDVRILTRVLQDVGIRVPFESFCAMELYAAYVGDWKSRKKQFKWQRLPHLAAGKSHDALVDCYSTRDLLVVMAGEKIDKSTELIDINF